VFRLGEDDALKIVLDEVPEALRSGVERAVRGCPRQALAIEE
jgi:ferredoxin